MKRIDLTIEVVLDDLKRVFEEQGCLNVRTYTKYGKYSVSKITQLDTFNNMKALILGESSIDRKNIPKKELVEDVLLIYSGTDKMTKDYYIKHGKFSRKPIERHFGSWNNMLKELSLKHNCLINIPKKDLTDELLRLYEEFETLSATVVKHHGAYSPEVYQRRFGSFNKAVIAAGLEPNDARGSDSPTARVMIKICSEVLGEKPVLEHTFSWLKNPETDKFLYIDAFFPENNLAFEYDGPQHFLPVKNYGGEEGLAYRQYLDGVKNSLLEQHNVKIFRFPYDTPHKRSEIIKGVSKAI